MPDCPACNGTKKIRAFRRIKMNGWSFQAYIQDGKGWVETWGDWEEGQAPCPFCQKKKKKIK